MARKKNYLGLALDIAKIIEQDRIEKQRREYLKRVAESSDYLPKIDDDETPVWIDRGADSSNRKLQTQLKELTEILDTALAEVNTFNFSMLQVDENYQELVIPQDLIEPLEAPLLSEYISGVVKPGGISKLIPGAMKKYEDGVRQAEANYQQAIDAYELLKQQREGKLSLLRTKYDQKKQQFEREAQARKNEVEVFEKAYLNRDPEAIMAYSTLVLKNSKYPEEFPKEFRIAYIPESKELVVEYELPNTSVIPLVAEYIYVKSRHSIKQKERKPTEIKSLYQDVVSAVCLRTVYELFKTDLVGNLEIIVFNGFVKTIDPATGNDIRPHLISLRTTRERFGEINLARVDKRVCLRNLGAQVSPRPTEMQAIKPVVVFDMVDKRFVEQSNILADIESRPNLMDLNPFEFEHFIGNLFDKIGFEAKLTRSRKDGGVDVVAYDPRPLLGGKIIIQAKRYSRVVGVSAVRDLYGTMINEGAGKGILVTTSHYGPDAFDFAKDKPIELIDGGGLLYLLQQQGIEARIVFPEA